MPKYTAKNFFNVTPKGQAAVLERLQGQRGIDTRFVPTWTEAKALMGLGWQVKAYDRSGVLLYLSTRNRSKADTLRAKAEALFKRGA